MHYNYDIVLEVEKNLKSFYEMEFVIYYVIDFYQKNAEELGLPYSGNLNVEFNAIPQEIPVFIEIDKIERDINLSIIYKKAVQKIQIIVHCHLIKDEDGLIRLKSYEVEKRTD